MRQMAVITPYAQFLFRFISETPEYDFCLSLFLLLYLFMCSIIELYIFHVGKMSL